MMAQPLEPLHKLQKLAIKKARKAIPRKTSSSCLKVLVTFGSSLAIGKYLEQLKVLTELLRFYLGAMADTVEKFT